MTDGSIFENNGSTVPILCPADNETLDISFQAMSETFPDNPTCDQIFCADFGRNEID